MCQRDPILCRRNQSVYKILNYNPNDFRVLVTRALFKGMFDLIFKKFTFERNELKKSHFRGIGVKKIDLCLEMIFQKQVRKSYFYLNIINETHF